MRVNGQARTRTQFESQLPKWKVEPVSVEVEKNDTIVQGFPVFEKLVKLSGINKTVDEVISDLWVMRVTKQDGEEMYWDSQNNEMLDWFSLCYKFLMRNYRRRRAYIKFWDKEIYWQVEVTSRRFQMATSEWVLIMPAVSVSDVFSNESKYVFFPMTALLSEDEQALFELYRTTRATPDEAVQIERDIMRLLEKLVVAKNQKKTINETNWQFAEIEQMCKDSWTIRKLSCQDWKLVLDFDWRKVMDTDWEHPWMVLPPLEIIIDLRNLTVRGNRCYHPHVMWDYSLCMGWTLTDLVQKCIRERDLKTLVGGMIDFGNSWTSSDAGDSDRHPASCIKRYYDNNDIDWSTVPVNRMDILHTLECHWYDRDSLWANFAALFDNEQ